MEHRCTPSLVSIAPRPSNCHCDPVPEISTKENAKGPTTHAERIGRSFALPFGPHGFSRVPFPQLNAAHSGRRTPVSYSDAVRSLVRICPPIYVQAKRERVQTVTTLPHGSLQCSTYSDLNVSSAERVTPTPRRFPTRSLVGIRASANPI